ncbi:MAG TPA: hypothetical protein VGS07_07860 [Thermoanaerobaculia bacterium]|jgi:hypothetical protein|nr:hypothetical protein [Thermoanaerobaculia bacterium]
MTLEIANETSGIVHVALYKRSPLRPAEPAVAWAIVSPPPRGRAIFSIPRDHRVFARYSFSPEDPWQPVYQTHALPLHRNHDSLSIREISLGRSAGAILARNARKAGFGELWIENDFSTAVWCHIQLGERDVLLPRLLSPRGVLIEALASPFFLAVVSPLTREGVPLAENEIRATADELEAGEGGVFTVRFTPGRGYRITRGAPLLAERATKPKEAAAPPRAKPKKAPPTPEKKPKAQPRPKADIKKREAAKKPAKSPAKKPASHRRGSGKAKKSSAALAPPLLSESKAGA